jgi:tellurite resistance protein
MTKNPTVQVERVLPAVGSFSVKEADAILEVAYLTTAADGRLTDEEHESFRAVASKLRAMASGGKAQVTDAALNKLFERYAGRIEHAERVDRLKALRTDLQREEARDLAYKVAYAMTLCDLETGEEESEFEEELIVALELSDERADALAGEVYEALDEEEGDEDEDDGEGDEDEDEDDEGGSEEEAS